MSRIDLDRPPKGKRKPWKKPRLERLGSVRDIAGQPPPFMQAAGNKFS